MADRYQYLLDDFENDGESVYKENKDVKEKYLKELFTDIQTDLQT